MTGNVVEFSDTQIKVCYTCNSQQRCADKRNELFHQCHAELRRLKVRNAHSNYNIIFFPVDNH
jgi:hypothetical protein